MCGWDRVRGVSLTAAMVRTVTSFHVGSSRARRVGSRIRAHNWPARERMRRFPGSTTFPSLLTALACQHVAHPRPGDAYNNEYGTSDNAGYPRHLLGDTTPRTYLHDRFF